MKEQALTSREVFSRPSLAYRFIKRTFDIAFSGCVIAVVAIPSALLSLAICAESSGGPIFRQKRVGKDGKDLYIYKFRSMYSDAHDHPERYMTREQLETWQREQKVDNDPRITKVGKFIRKMSLDEVPQFLNVFMGEMSVVGPRPVTMEETYEFGDSRDEVLSVKPGITGWWQVTDRNNATWESGRRQELELYYVRNQSAVMDLKVIAGTFGAMIGGTGK